MGLAGVKNKRKIGDDPNNTKWARNTNNFGQKILRAHGWEPGQYLGQKDAAHAVSYTAASASHIRAFLREDNLGIGASNPDANQCTGLDVFKDLLGRLNGQSAEVTEKQRQARENVRMTLYVERRFGPMRFVRGGFLIGDDETNSDETKDTTITTSLQSENQTATLSPSTQSDEDATGSDSITARKKAKKEKGKEEKKAKSRKRKTAGHEDGEEEDDIATEKKRKRRKQEGVSEDDSEGKESNKKKKDKKDKKDRKKREEGGESDKKERKEKKPRSKDKAKKEKEKSSTRRDEEAAEEQDLGTATPSESEQTAAAVPKSFTSTSSSSRLARRRYINQKRAAVSDPQALKQIFMIKA
ncbi:telomerase inhibitor [Sporothrix epigloea]|uniref:PinX1-related protein 1 n=1 Tax=Sporothrix epigloea TaxID=1892477 RepID=A0ABP0DAW4_9PEZI